MPYDVGDTLKKCRNNAKMSVKQISDILTQKGFKASESTIYSWENGNSQPTPGALLAMCKEYGISDVLTTFGYDGYNEDGSIQLNINEIDLIEKYRFISQHSPDGIEAVNYTLNREYKIAEKIYNSVTPTELFTYSHDALEPQAAHNEHESDPDEQEKMREDLHNLKRPK